MRKHVVCLLALFLTLLLALAILPSRACTNLIVGKKASADGSVMCSYNCDGFGFSGSLFYSPAGRHTPGEPIAIHGWGPYHEGRFVPQVEYTYNVVGLMNEHQLTIVETTFDGRLELVNSDGLFDYFSLMRIALQRCRNARQAIKCMAEMVEAYGYNSSGETITICDPDEAWIMEIIGKGEKMLDAKGKIVKGWSNGACAGRKSGYQDQRYIKAPSG